MVFDGLDAFPLDAVKTIDTDGGVGDNDAFRMIHRVTRQRWRWYW